MEARQRVRPFFNGLLTQSASESRRWRGFSRPGWLCNSIRFLCKRAPNLTVISVSASIPQLLSFIDFTVDGIPGTAHHGGCDRFAQQLHSNYDAKPVGVMAERETYYAIACHKTLPSATNGSGRPR